MHLYTRIVLLMAISSVVNCFSILEGISQEGNESHRDGRRINGIAVSRQETEEGSKPCTSPNEDYKGGNVTIYGSGGVFENPKEPAEWRNVSKKKKRQRQGRQSTEFRVYKAELCPNKEEVVQIQLGISMKMKEPTNGKCTDKLVFKGANKGLKIPELCGIVGVDTPQILFIDIDHSEGPFVIEVTIFEDSSDGGEDPSDSSSSNRYGRQFPPGLGEWDISISFLTILKAVTPRCLQYHTEPMGTIQSFNYGGQGPLEISHESLVNMRYSICFEYPISEPQPGYCGIKFDFDRFDVGSLYGTGTCTDDYLLIGDDKYCGDTGPDVGTGSDVGTGPDDERKIVEVEWTGPIYVNVRMDGNNDDQEEGFKANYTMMPCPFTPRTASSILPIRTSISPTTTTNTSETLISTTHTGYYDTFENLISTRTFENVETLIPTTTYGGYETFETSIPTTTESDSLDFFWL